ncbi:Tannase/feruloyl esterase [Phaeosphaeriaceae sp. PMI808]|nr:Tannase/feruloyl esterase [Phaeosphaeriaceae sp. PMI808]
MKTESSLWALLLNASIASSHPTNGDGDMKSKCAGFASKLAVKNGDIYFSQFVAAGTNLSLPDNHPSCGIGSMVVPQDICRVALSVATSKRSNFIMEAWLPSNWTGRFMSGGNGGLNGCINYADISYASSLGFASVGTNNGHNGTSGEPFYNNSDIVEDFAYRALHTGVIVGKQITKNYYGKAHKKSYYLGCSTGGRQGFKSAQTFPGDFDGIVAGAPAIAFNNLTSWSGSFYNKTGPPNSPTFLSVAQWAIVQKDVYKQCDALDGFVDGILEDASLCQYDPSGLACPEGTTSSTTCLTPAQIKTVKAIHSPLLNGNGDLVYPRLSPGAEAAAGAAIMTGQPFIYTIDWFRYALYNNPSWDANTISPTDYDNNARANLFNIQTWDGDLSRFQKRGSKVIHWHGGADPIISNENSPRYYKHVSSTMGLSPKQLDDFYRYFSVSGTSHCRGGDGANVIGQGINSFNSLNPKENILMAIVDWVEKGNAPEALVGTKWVNNTKSLGVQYQRAHCKYPKRNQYKGQGDPNAISSWECVDQVRN